MNNTNIELLNKIIDSVYDGIYYVDMNSTITFWSKGAERITGYKKEEVVGKRCSQNILRHIDEDGNELCINGCPLHETIKDGEVREVDVFLHHRDGHRVPVSVRVSPMENDANEIIGAVEIFTDSSSRYNRIREVEALRNEVYYDQLTGVGNRKYADMNLAVRLDEFTTSRVPFSVIFLAIDNFKKFNDSFGHNVGDQVLKMVGKTIANILRRLDVVCRWGGEEFIVIVPNVDDTILSEIAERIRVFIERSWVDVADTERIGVSVSLGATHCVEGDTVESVIGRADALMYESKKNGKNRVTLG